MAPPLAGGSLIPDPALGASRDLGIRRWGVTCVAQESEISGIFLQKSEKDTTYLSFPMSLSHPRGRGGH
jgi:hypothetical protein